MCSGCIDQRENTQEKGDEKSVLSGSWPVDITCVKEIPPHDRMLHRKKLGGRPALASFYKTAVLSLGYLRH